MLGFLSCSTRSTIFFPQIWNKRVEGTPFQFVGPKIIKGVGFSRGGWGSGRKWEYLGDILVFQEGYHDETNIKETTHIYQ